jgi:hypothetical protein
MQMAMSKLQIIPPPCRFCSDTEENYVRTSDRLVDTESRNIQVYKGLGL